MFEDVLCVIPARAGSKGIRNKNKRPVSGVPLAIYSIRSAIEAGIPHDHVVISTNDDEIAGYGKAWGIHVRMRPEDLCGDTASTEDAMLDALVSHPDQHRIKHILLLQPTSPVRLRDRIRECLLKYMQDDYDSLVTVTKFPNMFWHKPEGNSWVPTYNITSRKMKQEFRIQDFIYFENGNIYITNVDVLQNTHCRIGNNPCILPISYLEGIQIDNHTELSSVDRILNAGLLRQTEEDLNHDSDLS
jgi:N-acylneuraminate cytidylyltransferase